METQSTELYLKVLSIWEKLSSLSLTSQTPMWCWKETSMVNEMFTKNEEMKLNSLVIHIASLILTLGEKKTMAKQEHAGEWAGNSQCFWDSQRSSSPGSSLEFDFFWKSNYCFTSHIPCVKRPIRKIFPEEVKENYRSIVVKSIFSRSSKWQSGRCQESDSDWITITVAASVWCDYFAALESPESLQSLREVLDGKLHWILVNSVLWAAAAPYPPHHSPSQAAVGVFTSLHVACRYQGKQ